MRIGRKVHGCGCGCGWVVGEDMLELGGGWVSLSYSTKWTDHRCAGFQRIL